MLAGTNHTQYININIYVSVSVSLIFINNPYHCPIFFLLLFGLKYTRAYAPNFQKAKNKGTAKTSQTKSKDTVPQFQRTFPTFHLSLISFFLSTLLVDLICIQNLFLIFSYGSFQVDNSAKFCTFLLDLLFDPLNLLYHLYLHTHIAYVFLAPFLTLLYLIKQVLRKINQTSQFDA